MKITIVTPNYNYKDFLKNCIENVYAQSKFEGSPDIEHIVIDACSSDGSVELLRDWSGKVETLPQSEKSHYSFSYVSEPDKGQTDAINKGLLRSTGDIMCWLNADETYLDNSLSKVCKFFEHNPSIDIAYGEINFVDKDGKFIRQIYNHKFCGFVLLYHGCYIPSAATFWTRKAFEKVGPLDPYYKVTMDFEYWCRFYKLGCRFGFIPSAISTFAWHDDNVSERLAERRYQERLRVQHLYAPKIPFGEKMWFLVIETKKKTARYFVRQVLKIIRRIFL